MLTWIAMKTRHAAALALVGWYLMMPPGNRRSLNSAAPLSKWLVWTFYDTAAECESGRAFILNLKNQKQEDKAGLDLQALTRTPGFTLQCIEADDPRLKEK